MKIAIVYPSLHAVGGAENVVIWLAESLAKRGHDIVLMTREFSESIWGKREDRPYTVCLLDFKKYRSTLKTNRAAGMALGKALASSDFDVINPHNYPASLWVYYARQHKNDFPDVILYLHNLTRNFYERLIDTHYRRLPGLRNIWNRYRPKKMFRSFRQILFGYRRLDKAAVVSCSRVLANSAYAAEIAKKIYGIEIQPCPLGVSPERYGDQRENQFKQARKGISSLTVARMEVQKNYDTVLKAVSLVKEKDALPAGFQHKIAGDGPYRKSFQRKARKLGIADVVQFLGSVPHNDIGRFYADAEFIVHIPLDEPFGLVPLEAALLKKPSIVSDHGGPAEIVIDGVTGYHVDALNPHEVAKRMDHLLNNPEIARMMGEAAYHRVMENMTWDVFVRNFEEHLKQIQGQNQAS